jgi:hypothetical protein
MYWAGWPPSQPLGQDPNITTRPAGGIYEPMLRTRCAKSSRLQGTLAGLSVSPVVLACSPVAGPIVDLRLGAGRAAPWLVSVPYRPTGVQLRRVITHMPRTLSRLNAAHACHQGHLQQLVMQGKRALQDYSLTPRRRCVVSSGPQRSEKFPSGKVLYQYPRAVYRDMKSDYAYIYPTGDSLGCAAPTTATPQPLVRKWLLSGG